MGGGLLAAAKLSKLEGRIDSALNSTFISLIPKKDKPLSFLDFRPISLCNLIYKLIAKIVALRLKSFLDKAISPKQFGFLRQRHIAEPIGITQEALHTIKKKNCAMVLKLNLEKDFDKVNWTYLRLILLQIGVPLGGVNWIMGCISMVNFVIMVNGTRSSFFMATHGIRKGCLLSALLFILVIEGLSLLIKDAKNSGKIRG